MSYDVSLYINTGGDSEAEVFWRNMTSNVAPMWRKAGADLADFAGKTAGDCVADLQAAIRAMEAEPETYRAMNPANGWGDYEGCLDFLKSIRDACATHPACTVHISR
jgi:hypothetical protein